MQILWAHRHQTRSIIKAGAKLELRWQSLWKKRVESSEDSMVKNQALQPNPPLSKIRHAPCKHSRDAIACGKLEIQNIPKVQIPRIKICYAPNALINPKLLL